jgi:hypothetical protein
MKKLFLLSVAIVMATIASAQIQFGIKAGLNLANLNISPTSSGESYSMKPDFHAGLLAQIPLGGKLVLQPEIMYSGQGVNATSSDGTITVKDNLAINYINVPVLFKYYFTKGLFAEVGTQIGFLLSADDKENGSSISFKSALKSTDFSGVFGLGFLSSRNIGIDARYNLGFTDLPKGMQIDQSFKNSVIQVGLFYLFNTGSSKK